MVSGRPFEVVVRFESSAHLEGVLLGLTILQEPGINLGGPNNHLSGLFTLRPGVGEAHFRSPGMVLMPGRYEVSAGMMQPGRLLIDQVADAAELEVLPSGDFVHGLVRMDGEWRLDQVSSES